MPKSRAVIRTTAAVKIIRMEIASMPLRLPACSSRNTEVGRTSVFLELQAGSLKGMLAISILMIFTAAVVLITARLFGMKKGDL